MEGDRDARPLLLRQGDPCGSDHSVAPSNSPVSRGALCTRRPVATRLWAYLSTVDPFGN